MIYTKLTITTSLCVKRTYLTPDVLNTTANAIASQLFMTMVYITR